MGSLLDELKRRKVFNVAAIYAVVAWLLIQIADVVLPTFNAPLWVNQAIIISLLAGFPIAIALAWFFKLSPDLASSDGSTLDENERQAAQYLAIATVFVVALVGVIAFRNLIPEQEELAVGGSAIDSIAILPFSDLSANANQQWFADGLSDEILNSLVRMGELEVASRTSSFAYRDSELDITDIAREMGVNYILEGSVRQTPERLRVTAQLIRAEDGFHVWSENYDRTTDEVISIQEDLAVSIAEALGTAIDPQALADMASVGTDSIASYTAYLRGKSYGLTCERSPGCIENFEEAVLIDPTFAEAQFDLANFWYNHLDPSVLTSVSNLSWEEVLEQFHLRINLAIQEANDPVSLLKYQSYLQLVNVDLKAHRDLLKQYVEERPYDHQARTRYIFSELNLGEFDAAIADLDVWVDSVGDNIDEIGWPMMLYTLANSHEQSNELVLEHRRRGADFFTNVFTYYHTHRSYIFAGEAELAAEELRLFRQTPNSDPVIALLEGLMMLRQQCLEGRTEEAAQTFETATAQFPQATDRIGPPLSLLFPYWDLLIAYGQKEREIELLSQFDNVENIFILSTFLHYPYFDPTPYDYLMSILERDEIARPPAQPPIFACN